MKRILFIVNDNAQSANTKIALIIARKVAERNLVFFAGFNNGSMKEVDFCQEPCEDFFRFDPFRVVFLANYKKRMEWSSRDVKGKMIGYLRNGRALYYNILSYCNQNIFLDKNRFLNQLNLFCDKHRIDTVITFSQPAFFLRIISCMNKEVKRVLIQLDPYVYNYALPKGKIWCRKREEERLFKKIDVIFTTSLIKDQMRRYLSLGNVEKIFEIEFPEIVKGRMSEKREVKKPVMHASGEKVQFVYTGAFYTKIRTPDFLVRLFLKMPENYILHVAGFNQRLIQPYQAAFGKRLILHGVLEQSEAEGLREMADILVNVNNAVDNMVPSKLFEYFETGKPILNICLVDNCPSLKYTIQYPYAYSISQQQYEEKDIDRITSFVKTNIGKRLEKKEVERIFYKNTDEYVASRLMEIIGV